MKNLINKRFGSLIVKIEIERKKEIHKNSTKISRQFICRCDCGKFTIRLYKQLVAKNYIVACDKCYKERKKPKRDPTVHIACGKKIKGHKKCKLCTRLLCEQGEKDFKDSYCESCYNKLIQ